MFLVAGLGNPGEEYALTPHNLGFLTVDRLAERHGIRVTRKDSKALIGLGEIEGREVMLAKPQTFMNLSGTSLAPLMEKHAIGISDLIVVYDELDLSWTALKIKPKGSAAGHNGMKSVIGSLKTSEFVRVRLGVHPGRPLASGMDYLLSPFKRSQKKELDDFTGFAADAVQSIIAEGVEKSMTRFNRRAPGLNIRGRMRIYEELFIIKPDVPEEEADQFVEHLQTHLTSAGATVDKVEKWGKRRLAYRVEKYREGNYVLIQFTGGPEVVKELERRLRVADSVLKFITVRIDETLKRLEKRKKVRDKRAAKRATQAPANPAPALPSLEKQMTESPAVMPGVPKAEA